MNAYVADLRAMVSSIEAAGPSLDAIAHRTGCGLLLASVRAIGARVSSELASVLVKRKLWTNEQSLAWILLGENVDHLFGLLASQLADEEPHRRDRLLEEASIASARITDEGGPARLAGLAAQIDDPHLQAKLLQVISAERDKGGRAIGLELIIPLLDPSLLDYALAAALEVGPFLWRARLLSIIAAARPVDSCAAAYAALFEHVRTQIPAEEALARRHLAGADLGGVLTYLATSLPLDQLPKLDELMQHCLDDDSQARAVGRAALWGRQLHPASAVSLASECADTWIGTQMSEQLCLGAARRYAEWGDTSRAVATLAHGGSRCSHRRMETLLEFADRIDDLEQPELLAWLGTAFDDDLPRIFRSFGSEMTTAQAGALAGVAAARDEPLRSRAIAPIAGLLTPDRLLETFETLLDGGFHGDEIALLAPHLSLDQAEYAIRRGGGCAQLFVRILDLGGPARAVAAVERLPLSRRIESLTSFAGSLPVDELRSALRAAMQRDQLTSERVRARLALAAALPSNRVVAIIAEAEVLPDLEERVEALTTLTELGQATAGQPLIEALQKICEDRDQFRADEIDAIVARSIVRVARSPDMLVPLLSVSARLRTNNSKATAYLALATVDRSAAAEQAAELLVALLVRDNQLTLPPATTKQESSCLHKALRNVQFDRPAQFANAVSQLADRLSDHEALTVLERVETLPLGDARNYALASLAASIG